jgi:hypothetical protein
MLFKFKQKLLIIVIRVIQFICRMHTNNTGILVANIKQTQQMQWNRKIEWKELTV